MLETNVFLTIGSGLDALSTPPLPFDGERTRYSPPDKNQNDLRPQPLRVQRNSSTDNEESPTSFIDMLKSGPNELFSSRKIKTPGPNSSPTSTTSPSDENVNPFPGGRPYFTFYNSETGQYKHVFLKGSNFSRNEIDKQRAAEERATYRTDTDTVDAFNIAHEDDAALEVSSPTRHSTRSVSKPSPLSTVRRKVSSMFTKESLNEANDSILSPSITKPVECITSLGSADELPIADPISTPTRKQLTRKASWIKNSLTKASSGDTAAHPNREHGPRSQQHEDFKVARPPCSVSGQSADHNRSEIASSEKGHQDVRQKFFFEEFHTNDLRAQAKADANKDNLKSLRKSRRQRVVKQGGSEVKAEATLNADTKQSEGPVAKETPNTSHNKSNTIPNIPEMDEATRQKEITSKEDSPRKEQAARRQQTSEEFIASKVSSLYVSSDSNVTDPIHCLGCRTAQKH